MTSTAASEFPLIISVDDHIQEPPDLWTERLPARYAGVGPRVLREEVDYVNSSGAADKKWGDVWYYEDQRYELIAEYAAAGTPADTMDSDPITYDEMRPGVYKMAERLEDMTLDHVEKSLCFPNGFVRFCGQRFANGNDKELSLLAVRAYNDYLADEWTAPSRGRLFAVGIVPLWDPQLAAEEVYRNAARPGMRAVAFSELPTRLGLPSLYTGAWEPFIKACDETATLICIHVGSSSTSAISSPDAPRGISALCHFGNSALSMCDWILSGALPLNPNIRLMYSEAQAGWIPFLIERFNRKWGEGYKAYGLNKNVPEVPSTYFKNQIYACVTDDPAAIMYLDMFGADNFCFETDYPHPDGSFPHSEAVARKLFGHLEPDNIYKIVRGNAERLLTGN
jgi:predicted TIM-barrel fold metal-dependent hydrolase